MKEFNPYIAAEAENKLKLFEDERRKTKFFASAIKLREQLLRSSRKLRNGNRTKGDFSRHIQLLKKFIDLFSSHCIAAEKKAINDYEKALHDFYEDPLKRTSDSSLRSE